MLFASYDKIWILLPKFSNFHTYQVIESTVIKTVKYSIGSGNDQLLHHFSFFTYAGGGIRRPKGERRKSWILFYFIGISYQNGLSCSDLSKCRLTIWTCSEGYDKRVQPLCFSEMWSNQDGLRCKWAQKSQNTNSPFSHPLPELQQNSKGWVCVCYL